MAAVYKSLSKQDDSATTTTKTKSSNGVRINKQRVLILSSRGVTYRYALGPWNPCLT